MSTVENNILAELGLTRSQSTAAKNDRLGQDQFLELMITQLKNQDPMKPMENGEFLGQMAQFSTVTGMQDLQTSFTQLADSLVSNQALQAATLVGRSVMVPSDTGVFDGASMRGAVELPSSVSEMAVGIYDASGQLLQQTNYGPQAAGLVEFQWNGGTQGGGKAAAGQYFIRAEARVDGSPVAMQTLSTARVDSVSLGRVGEEITLNLAGLGSVGFSNVRQIMQ